MKLLFLVLSASLLMASPIVKEISQPCQSKIEELDEAQYEVLAKSYFWGEPFGFGITLGAIAWAESCLGRYKINLQDPSAGNYHNSIKSVLARHPEIKNTALNQNIVAHMLVNDDKFAATEALSELTFWETYYKENPGKRLGTTPYEAIIKSYNRGLRWQNGGKNNQSANQYLSRVKTFVKTIERHVERNRHLFLKR